MRKIYTEEDFSFLPEKQRAIAVKLINKGCKAATHSTQNEGSWDIVIPSDEMIAAVGNQIRDTLGLKKG